MAWHLANFIFPRALPRVHREIYVKFSLWGLTFVICYSILSHMNINKPNLARARAKIIAELASLPSAVQGKICEDRRALANGKIAVYHNLQYWADGDGLAGQVEFFHSARSPHSRARESGATRLLCRVNGI